MINEWQKIGQQVAYDGKFRPTIVKTYKLPNGRIGKFEISGAEGVEAVAILALTRDKKIIICEQFRPGPEKILDELPAGRVDEGEDLEKAARRELLEETGYEPGEMKYLGSIPLSAYDHSVHHFFFASGCEKKADLKLDELEDIEVKLVSIEEFMQIPYKRGTTDIGIYFFARSELEKLIGEKKS